MTIADTPLRSYLCEAATSVNCRGAQGCSEEEAKAEGYRLLRTTCYRCGLPVCASCSSRRFTWYPRGKRIRICDNCLLDERDGEAKVLLRRYHEAGYPKTILADCKRELAGTRG